MAVRGGSWQPLADLAAAIRIAECFFAAGARANGRGTNAVTEATPSPSSSVARRMMVLASRLEVQSVLGTGGGSETKNFSATEQRPSGGTKHTNLHRVFAQTLRSHWGINVPTLPTLMLFR